MSAVAELSPEALRLENVEAWLLSRKEQAPYELKHSFAPGIYLREIFMPAPKGVQVEEGQVAGVMLIGHEHNFEHFNMVLCGRARVSINGITEEIVGPCYFKSGAGVRKVLWVTEDMRWVTIHPNEDDCHDIPTLEARLIKPSATFERFQEAIKLQEYAEHGKQFKPRLEEINA